MKTSFAASVLLLLPLFARPEPVSLKLGSGIAAVADYQPGAADRPAVMILHGFLQTHHFHTVFSALPDTKRDAPEGPPNGL